jgi:hypothetical protein
MRPLHAAFLAAAVPVASFAFSAACGGSSSNGEPSDAGPADVGLHRDSANASSSSGSSSGGGGEGGMVIPPAGKQLVATMNLLTVDAVTSDGNAIYTDNTDNSVWAVPVAGGTPQKITTNVGPVTSIGAVGPVALMWTNLNPTTSIGQLVVWTAAKGTQSLSTQSSVGAAISKDYSHIAFLDNSTKTSTAIAVAGTDGSGKMTLVPTTTVSATCTPAVGWVGGDALASYCTSMCASASDAGAGDAGAAATNPATITRYAAGSWTPTNISTCAAPAFAANSTADHVLFFDNGGLEAFNISSAATTPVDPNGDSFVITPDGAKVVFGTHASGDAGTAGPFKVSPIASPSPTTLGNGIDAFYSISPDGNWVLGFTQLVQTTNFSNTILASTMTPGTPTQLVQQPTSSSIGDDWTTDSKFAIFTDTIMTTMTVGGSVTSGNLNVVAVAGASPMQLGTAVWQEAAATGSKVIFNPNWIAPPNLGFGVADLTEIDLSSASPSPKVLVSAADANFFLTPDKMTIVYSYSTGGGSSPSAMSGLWALPVP